MSQAETSAHPRRWEILGVLVVSLLVVVLDNTVLNVALKTIQEDLHATQSQLVWAINSYTVVFAAFLFTWGVLGDRLGRKKVLMAGLLLFGAASAVTAFSQTANQLIVARGFMGAFGASVLPVTLAIITVVFPPNERGKAIGVWAAAVGGAVAIGPILGGLLLEWFWWGSVFFINVPIVIVGVIGIWVLVPESRNPRPGQLDPVGLVLSVTALLLLVYGIEHGGDTQKWTSVSVLGPFLAGLALLALFVYQQWRSRHPSLDTSLFRIRSFSVSLAAVSMTFGAMFGSFLFLTFYMQLVRGYSPLKAGVCSLPVAIGQFLAAPRSSAMVARFGARRVISTGLVLVGIVFIALAFATPTTPLWALLVFFFVLGLGMGSVTAPATTRMTLAMPQAKAGAGSAVQNTVRQVAAALGVAIISSVVATVYRGDITSATAAANLPAPLRGAVSDSIGGAYEAVAAGTASGALSPAAGQQIEAAATDSFIAAFHVGSYVSTALVLAALLVIVLFLPEREQAVAWSASGSVPDATGPGPGATTAADAAEVPGPRQVSPDAAPGD